MDAELESNDSLTTYTRSVNNTTYYSVVISLFTCQAVAAILVDDPTLVSYT
jgi:hypothetical protein